MNGLALIPGIAGDVMPRPLPGIPFAELDDEQRRLYDAVLERTHSHSLVPKSLSLVRGDEALNNP